MFCKPHFIVCFSKLSCNAYVLQYLKQLFYPTECSKSTVLFVEGQIGIGWWVPGLQFIKSESVEGRLLRNRLKLKKRLGQKINALLQSRPPLKRKVQSLKVKKDQTISNPLKACIGTTALIDWRKSKSFLRFFQRLFW